MGIKSESILQDYCERLLVTMLEEIEIANKEKISNNLEHIYKCLEISRRAMMELQEYVLNREFRDGSEEIAFFKEIKPQFYSRLIYFHKIYNLEVSAPVGNVANRKDYFQKELDNINSFYNDNRFWYQYYQSRETYLDEKLFKRYQCDAPLSWRIYDINVHPGFSSRFDYIFSRFISNEMLVQYLQNVSSKIGVDESFAKPLIWTDSKVGLVEMCYSFKAKGTFNSGKATLKEIADFFQHAFQVEINNPTRDLQEILRRKTGYTTYLDSLKDSYLKYVDAIENRER